MKKHTEHEIQQQINYVEEEIDILREGASKMEDAGFGYESRRYLAALAQMSQAKRGLESRLKDAEAEASREPAG